MRAVRAKSIRRAAYAQAQKQGLSLKGHEEGMTVYGSAVHRFYRAVKGKWKARGQRRAIAEAPAPRRHAPDVMAAAIDRSTAHKKAVREAVKRLGVGHLKGARFLPRPVLLRIASEAGVRLSVARMYAQRYVGLV